MLEHGESTPDASMEASVAMLKTAEHLFADWDGAAARGPSGTAGVVAFACGLGLPVTVIWPVGASR